MAKFKWRKALKITGIVLLAFIILLLLAINFLMPVRESAEKVKQYFQEKQTKVTIHHEKYKGEEVRYLATASAASPDSLLLVLVHGAPGSSADMQAFMTDKDIVKQTQIIAVDRLGYGYSQYGKSVTSIAEQAAFIRFVINQFPHKKVVLVGHSYGGPITAKLAMDNPELIAKVIMLAPLNEPASEPIFKIGYLAKWKATRWLLPKAIGVAADEKFSHIAELEKMVADWQDIQVPLVHIHGTADALAPFSNIAFSKQHIPADKLETITLETNHFLPWSDYELVKKVILEAF